MIGVREIAVPAKDEIAARNILVRADTLCFASAEQVPLEGDGINRCRSPVEPESAAKAMPAVVRRSAARKLERVLTKCSSINPVGELGARVAPEADSRDLLIAACLDLRENPGCRGCVAGDDVDDPVHGIGAPQGRAGA